MPLVNRTSRRRVVFPPEPDVTQLGSYYHMAPRVVADSRKLLHAIASKIRVLGDTWAADVVPGPAVIDAWPDETPTIEESVAEFLPTAILLKRVAPGSRARLDDNGDHSYPQRFVTSIHVTEGRRVRPGGHVMRVAARCYPAPPAEPCENLRRAQAMAALHKGAPLSAEDGWAPGLLSGRLEADTRRMARMFTLDEQIALATLLTAREGWAAFVSRDGDWPANAALSHIAGRLRCRVVRISFAGIPRSVIRRLRHARYDV